MLTIVRGSSVIEARASPIAKGGLMEPQDKFRFKVPGIEISADGKFAIAASVVIVLVLLATKVAGLW